MKIEFPRIKKELKRFLFDEFGGCSKKSIIKLGVYSLAASLLASKVVRAGANEVCDISSDKCKISCDSLTGVHERGIAVHAEDVDGADDYCRTPTAQSIIDSLASNDGFVYDQITFSSEVYGEEDKHAQGEIDFSDLVAHQNSLLLQSSGEAITATHSHSISSTCAGTKLEFHSNCHDSNEVTCWCDIYEDGVKKPAQDFNGAGHTYYQYCDDC